MPIAAVVSEKMNGELILGSDVVGRLHNQLLCEQYMNGSDEPVMHVYANKTDDVDDNDKDDHDDNDNLDAVDGDEVAIVNDVDDVASRKASVDVLRTEQLNDKSLAVCWSLAQRGQAGYFEKDGLLYRNERILNYEYEQLCLPKCRRSQAINLRMKPLVGISVQKDKVSFKVVIYVARDCE